MSKDRALLRRGSRKMQDGTLGQKSDNETTEDGQMNIHIGDLVVSQTEQPPPSIPEVARPNIAPASEGAWGPLKKAILATALLTGGGGLATIGSWALGAFDHPTPPAMVDTDTDTRIELIIESEE